MLGMEYPAEDAGTQPATGLNDPVLCWDGPDIIGHCPPAFTLFSPDIFESS